MVLWIRNLSKAQLEDSSAPQSTEKDCFLPWWWQLGRWAQPGSSSFLDGLRASSHDLSHSVIRLLTRWFSTSWASQQPQRQEVEATGPLRHRPLLPLFKAATEPTHVSRRESRPHLVTGSMFKNLWPALILPQNHREYSLSSFRLLLFSVCTKCIDVSKKTLYTSLWD
jgi:hypothetical protein